MTGSRHQGHQYAHEVFEEPPYDGMLVSKAIIDGYGSNLRYSFTQVQRLKRIGISEFLRLTRSFRASLPRWAIVVHSPT